MCKTGLRRKNSILFKAIVIALVAALCRPAIGAGLGEGGRALAQQDVRLSTAAAPSFSAMPQSAYLVEKWKTAVFGRGIGASNINISDLDEDGDTEVVVSAEAYEQFWYILSYNPALGGYQQEWISAPYVNARINKMTVGSAAGNGQQEIYVAWADGHVEVYDGVTRSLQYILTTGIADPTGITLADVDDDGGQEIVFCSSSQIAVYNAQTYEQEWQTLSAGGADVAVANVDADPAPEIVTTRYVIDGISHVVEWDYTSEFGFIIELADIDGDSLAEIVGAAMTDHIWAYDADTHSVKWQLNTSPEIRGLRVADVDGDTVQEVIHGVWQGDAVYCFDSVTLAEEWSIYNAIAGHTDVNSGDTDNDGQVEVVWGAGALDSGSDYLYVADATTATVEWQSIDLVGPLSALDVDDVDSDGTEEIVMVSYQSDSGYSDGIIFVYNAETYELEWQSEPVMGYAFTGVHALQVADVDDDGTMEIVIATDYIGDGVIRVYNGVTHAVEWQSDYLTGSAYYALAIADVDNDGDTEVVGGNRWVGFCVLDGRSGVEEWRTPNPGYDGHTYNIAVADSDADGNPEIVFAGTGRYGCVYDGVTHDLEWQNDMTALLTTIVFDVDQDGVQEILFGTSTGRLYAYDGQTYAQEWLAQVSGLEIRGLRVVDLNGDGSLEILVADLRHLSARDAETRNLIWLSGDLSVAMADGNHLVARDIDGDTRDEVVFGNAYALYVMTSDLLPYGPTMQVDRALARPGEPLNYALGLRSFSSSTTTLSVSDPLPTGTLYLDGSLWASKGTYGLVGNTVFWAVTMEPAEQVSLTFAVSVGLSVADGSEIVNTAIYSDGAIQFSRSVSTVVDARPPESVILHPLSGEIVSGTSYPIEGTASDAVSGVDSVAVRVGEEDWQVADGTTGWALTWTLPLTDCEVTIGTRATDGIGWVETPGPSVTVLVDNLPPHLVSTVPADGSGSILLNQPIVIEVSEPVLSETLQFLCQPDPGGWSVESSPDGRMLTLFHNPFVPGQMYSLAVTGLDDRAGHALVTGPVPNPWAFTTGQGSCTPIETVGIDGPPALPGSETGTYTATYTPLTATLPITFTWDNGSSGPTAGYSWDLPGMYTVTLTVTNPCGQVVEEFPVEVTAFYRIYLPLIERGG